MKGLMKGNTRLSSVWVAAAIVLLPLLLLLWPTLEGIFNRWLKFDESYSHGFLLLLISFYLIFRVVRSRAPTLGFYPLWLAPFLLALVAYGLGDLLRVQALQHLVLVPLLLGALAVLLGWAQVRFFIIPVGLLFFAMPVWDFLSWTLQLITVEVNQFLLGLFDIEFKVEGVFVYLIGVGAFEVAHGCSGLRYLLVGQSLAMMYGELNLRSIRARLILFVASVFLALVANWIRVFVIIYMGYETNMQTSLIKEHDNFGWWVFAATLVPLFLVGRRLESMKIENNEGNSLAGIGDATGNEGLGSTRNKFGVAITALIPMLFWVALPASESSVKPEPAELELRLDGERYGPLFSSNLEGWRPMIHNPDRVFVQTLFDRDVASEQAGIGRAYYAAVYGYDHQRESAEVVHYSNRVFDRSQWHTDAFFAVPGPDDIDFTGVTLRHRNSGEVIHVAYAYYVEGFWETDELQAKLAQVRGFFNARTDASLVVFGVSCEDCDGGDALEPIVHYSLKKIISALES